MSKNLCIIQARTGSTRLPDKVLLKVNGLTMLEYMVKRLKLSKKIDKIVIATSVNKNDEKIARLCDKIGISCFRGSEDDVLDRYYQCSLKYKDYENIIRLTADCPLIDPFVIDEVITYFEKNKELDYASNVLERTFPHGLDTEIFKRQALYESAEKSLSPSEREHMDGYVLNNKRFKKGNLSAAYNFSHFRITLDYEEDFAVIKFLIENSKPTDSYLCYVSLLSRNPQMMFKNINYNIENDFLKAWSSFKKDFSFATGSNQKTIVVLGGALVKDKSGEWRTTNYDEGDNFGVSGDKLRVLAAEVLVKDLAVKENFLIVASGGRGQYRDIPGVPTLAGVIKNELIKLGVPADKILEENKSNNTFEQLQELKKIIKARKLQDVTIISNKYHLPRVQAMINYDAELKEMSGHGLIALKTIAAEDILIEHEPAVWKKIIDQAYASEGVKERIALEKKGVKQIKAGTYNFKRKYAN